LIKSKTKIIAKNYEICESYSSKALGLMFSPKQNLIFAFDKPQRVSLHMLFVFYPIWAVYLNSKKEAVHIQKLYPFVSFIYPEKKAKYILELIEQPKIKIGDKISWKAL